MVLTHHTHWPWWKWRNMKRSKLFPVHASQTTWPELALNYINDVTIQLPVLRDQHVLTKVLNKNKFAAGENFEHVLWNSNIATKHTAYITSEKSQPSVNTTRTRRFPGADIGRDHELVLMTFALHLKSNKRRGNIITQFDVENLKVQRLWKPSKRTSEEILHRYLFLPKRVLNQKTSHSFNKDITETATKVLSKHRPKKKPWVTDDILDLCDERCKLKKNKPEGRKQ